MVQQAWMAGQTTFCSWMLSALHCLQQAWKLCDHCVARQSLRFSWNLIHACMHPCRPPLVGGATSLSHSLTASLARPPVSHVQVSDSRVCFHPTATSCCQLSLWGGHGSIWGASAVLYCQSLRSGQLAYVSFVIMAGKQRPYNSNHSDHSDIARPLAPDCAAR
jgi:hypothetical protein